MFWQLVPHPYSRREERFFIEGGTAEWDPVPMLVSPCGCSCLAKLGRQLYGDNGVHNPVHHGGLGYSPSLAEGLPF